MKNSYRDILPQHYAEFPGSDLNGSIVDRFRKIVAQHGARVAIQHNDESITYALLDLASSALAALLLTRISLSRAPVAMMYKHGPSYNVAQFAVLKSGNFYANIDCELKLERQLLILGDLDARIILCDDACAAKAGLLAQAFPDLLVVNTESVDLFGPGNLPEISITPQDYAYIVYTSGSTGPPQGVIVSHASVLHFTRNHTNYMHLHSDDRATQICPLWTGASAAEIFPVLLNGASLFPYSVNTHGLQQLTNLLTTERITMFTAVPILFRMTMQAIGEDKKFADMRMLRLAGDRTTRAEVALFQKHFTKKCLLRVGLGASEALMFAHFFIDTEYQMAGEIAPVGYALEDMELLLLDDDWNEIKTAGEYGEIAVRSKYLSVGYWKNPALTQERFLTDGLDHEKKIYLSRDIGYRDAQGRLHHAGRIDARVKIYGKMYLVTDVEAALLGINHIKEAVVIPFDSGARGTELAAYIVTENGYCDLAAIRQQLAAKVAAEIRPRTITILDAMPLHTNNKINRLQLKDYAGPSLSQEQAVSQFGPQLRVVPQVPH